eukprot:scaffold10429_cov126-Cylindrotheca_fusiformis.AAC.16
MRQADIGKPTRTEEQQNVAPFPIPSIAERLTQMITLFWILSLASMGVVSGYSTESFGFANTTAEEQWPTGSLNCAQGFQKYDPLTQKRVYTVGVHAPSGSATARKELNLTFETYLNAAVGRRWDPPIQFKMRVSEDPLHDWIDEKEDVDFMYSDTGIYSCFGVEVGAQPLVNTVSHLKSRGRPYDLDIFAGTMIVLATNERVNDVEDLKDKVIGAQAFSDFAGAQAQFYVMGKNGVDFVVDPKQVVFTGDNDDTVQGVLDGSWDVGFVRTGHVERTIDPSTGKLVDPTLFKILEPRIHIMDGGELFPFLHSTPVFPEWPLYTRQGVDRKVIEEVTIAMINFGHHLDVGDKIHDCIENSNSTTELSICNTMPPAFFDPGARCDTTRELAELTYQAGKAGYLRGFRPAGSHFAVRTMQQDAGFIIQKKNGDWFCERAATLYDGIFCPEGYYKVPQSGFANQCDQAGQPCPEGYSCFCKPCIQAFEVSVFPFYNETYKQFFYSQDYGCDKMSLCGSTEQREPIVFRAFDNRQRENVTVTALLHIGQESILLDSQVVGEYLYEVVFSRDQVGVAILEVFVDDIQIPESPFRVEIVARDCEVEFPGQAMTANLIGVCECSPDTIAIGNECVPTGTFAAILASVGFVNVEELHFSYPVETIGQGAFGVVVLAEYRGTQVAIKRVLPFREKRSGKGSVTNNSLSKDTAQKEEDAENEIDGDTDVEAMQTSSFGARNGSLVVSGSKTSVSDLDFLGGLSVGGKKTLLQRWLPFLFSDETTSRTILGNVSGGASSSSKSLFTRIFPYCGTSYHRQQEFMAEMRLLSRLRHPCITTVMGAVMAAHEPMMVMEYMENGSLYDLLRNETLYTGGEMILQILRDVAQGLRFLHASKPPILHGDLKAKNILIDSRFRAKVADFGLATKNKNGLSGTPFWMAPEYLRRKTEYTTSCDIYAFGMIMYEIYSRKIPYEGQNPKKILRKVCDPRINYRPSAPKTCPRRMTEIMQKCWSSDPFFRPVAKDLDLGFGDMSINDAEPIVAEVNPRLRTGVPTGDMLYKVFPKKVADQLNAGQKVEPETHDNVTVFFSDIIRFTDISRALTAVKVCDMLDRLYLAFDQLANQHGVFKVETIGDAWMGVTNLEGNQNDTHAKRVAEFAIDAVEAAGRVLIDEDDPRAGCLHIRVGFHSGSVVSNVIGSLNPRYGLFGDTVNTASRMESLALSGKIQCSEASAELLREQAPNLPLRKRGKVAVKGKGTMTTYWVGGQRREDDRDIPHVGDFDEHPVVAFKEVLSPTPSVSDKPKAIQERSPYRIKMSGSIEPAEADTNKNGKSRSSDTHRTSRNKNPKKPLRSLSQ